MIRNRGFAPTSINIVQNNSDLADFFLFFLFLHQSKLEQWIQQNNTFLGVMVDFFK